MTKVWLYHGNSEEVLTRFAGSTIDAVIMDPPYKIGFAGKDWDQCEESFQSWTGSWAPGLFEVMKPGAHLLSFGGTRTEHHVKLGLEKAGFVIMDTFVWLHGQGLPKSQDLSFVPGFEGFGTALRPGWEPIIWAMKPFVGRYRDNVESVAGLNIAGCLLRDSGPVKTYFSGKDHKSPAFSYQGAERKSYSKERPGRWPPNVILDDVVARMLDESQGRDISRFYYNAKAPAKERHADLDGDRIENVQPTVKPLGLVQWLIRLVKGPGDRVILDPFLGSGTTAVGALREGCSCVGIDQEEEYLNIARQRILRDSILNKEKVTWVKSRNG